MSTVDTVRPIIEAWLAGCKESTPFYVMPEEALWAFQRDALGSGIVEVQTIDRTPVLALSLALNLPPIRTMEDAHAILEVAAGMPPGVAVVEHSFAQGDEVLHVQITVPLETVTQETLPDLYRRLARAKHLIEDDAN